MDNGLIFPYLFVCVMSEGGTLLVVPSDLTVCRASVKTLILVGKSARRVEARCGETTVSKEGKSAAKKIL